MQNAPKTYVFQTMPIKKAVLRQALPAVAGQMIMLIYSLADTYFVGLLNDPRQTAAVTVSYPAVLMLTAISNLVGVGGAAALARALGRGRPDEAREISSVSIVSAAVLAAVFSAAFALLMRPVLTLCGATAETLAPACGYAASVIAAGGAFAVLSAALSNLVRAEGHAGAASFGLSLGGALNILLDPFFILPRFLGLGAAGAGAATAVSNAASFLFFVIWLRVRRGETLVAPKGFSFAALRRRMGEILKTGFPSAVQYALTVVAVAAQARFVSNYETAAVAGLGIVKKLDQLPLYFSIGVSTGLLPLLAFNHASGDTERLERGFRFGTALSLGFSAVCLVVYEIFAPQLAGLFIGDEATVAYAASFLRRMVTAMPLMSVCYPLVIRFQATGRNRAALVCSVLRKGVLDVPLLFVMDALVPLYGLMWVQPIVDGISLLAALAFLRGERRRPRAE
ncbi:MAG: MATE family efflux transporter [Clostridia bacterium]|nr:MATE family efflux transporter [Clostridia bacterium]